MVVADVAFERGPVVTPADTPVAAMSTAESHATDWVAIVDGETLEGWLPATDLAPLAPDRSIGELELRSFVATVTPETPLREALDIIVRSRTRRAAVVDDARYMGMVTIESVAGGLQ